MSGGSYSMARPIWVWCYVVSEPRNARGDMPPLSVWPQAHTYAFSSEEEALAHPSRAGWKPVHSYVLQKVYLQGDADADMLASLKEMEAWHMAGADFTHDNSMLGRARKAIAKAVGRS